MVLLGDFFSYLWSVKARGWTQWSSAPLLAPGFLAAVQSCPLGTRTAPGRVCLREVLKILVIRDCRCRPGVRPDTIRLLRVGEKAG